MRLPSLLAWSLRLDYDFLAEVTGLSAGEKVRLILLKYLTPLAVRMRRGGAASAALLGGRYHYVDPTGIASLQRVFCSSHGLREFMPRNPVVVDVGANVGQFHFFAQQYLQARRIVSIEPLPECHDVLRRNAFSGEDCVNCAVGCATGEVVFHEAEQSQLSSRVVDEGVAVRKTRTVPCRSLDSIMAERQVEHVDLLKIDTEGTELDVLRSAEATLARTGAVFVEMSVFRKATGTFFQIGTFLEERGFRLVDLTVGSKHRPKDMDALFLKMIEP